jgi:hypothetical protein
LLRCWDVKAERIERAIADNVEFLTAHPIRRSTRISDREGDWAMDPKRKAARAELNRQMRDRIRLLAAERGLPESEIKPVISRLRHEEVMKFVRRHRVSYDWLLCGCLKGRLRMARGSRWSAGADCASDC